MKKVRTTHHAHSIPCSQIPESMAALARGMADDFNNILTTLMGACSLIDKDEPANNELLQYVALIRASAERAAVLTDRLVRAGTRQQKKAHSDSHLVGPRFTTTSVRDKKAIHDIVATTKHPDGASS